MIFLINCLKLNIIKLKTKTYYLQYDERKYKKNISTTYF